MLSIVMRVNNNLWWDDSAVIQLTFYQCSVRCHNTAWHHISQTHSYVGHPAGFVNVHLWSIFMVIFRACVKACICVCIIVEYFLYDLLFHFWSFHLAQLVISALQDLAFSAPILYIGRDTIIIKNVCAFCNAPFTFCLLHYFPAD